MPPDAVLFDLDDTLCRYRRSGSTLLSIAFERTGIDPFVTVEEYHDRYPEFVAESESVADLRERCFVAIAADKGYDPDRGQQIAQVYANERDHRNVERISGVETALSALSDIPVGLVTNGAPGMQGEKLDAIGLSGAFDAVIYAGYDTPAKPSPAPFEAVLSSLSARPERSYHVGNSIETDVAGANTAGIGSVWLAEGESTPDRSLESAPDHTISTLAALPSVLGIET